MLQVSGEPITIVSGLPRSGTSMMMRMLQAGGFPVYTDGVRQPDEDNPNGYYEVEAAKGLVHGENAWLREVRGKAVKIVSPLLRFLPKEHDYRIILMRRRMVEILASQRIMLQRRGEPANRMSDDELARIYEEDLRKVEVWMGVSPNVRAVFVSYNDLLSDPYSELWKVESLLEAGLDLEAMAAIVDPALYRQRH